MTDITSTIIPFAPGKDSKPAGHPAPALQDTVFFTRREFESILNIYGKMVASGHWKDYAIDSRKDRAIFSIYQNRGDQPLYQIHKIPKLQLKQGAFVLSGTQGKILKRGHDIELLLTFFHKQLIKLVR